ncbi:hypothetical protein OG887_42965 (plasmid) [Streptomyces sp. NBC_00053]|uniref:hypothetical protein n=1 Tax=unclassified Streptomyces TaxID=2593676 RepID=UPI0022556EEA|nr:MULTISPECIES: hypothetical protein [unclassified Streptomyces]MCX4400116.1 hypothetical protein [Streptomyces sp. NBC_01767]MCX5103031.1 hypothetical protein [Streptomyces sp. NBC_00439]MCX5106678.1 hypothetical protein [Streptomyces sp. NBC_00439]MCX5505505.1 hypothetical protein [Streptomyces sp. NBC_00052]MCX5545955.1 hypothetical protein [Streptomyces sp. NBC_00051]
MNHTPSPAPDGPAPAVPRTSARGCTPAQTTVVVLLVFGGFLLPVVGWLIGLAVWLPARGWSGRAKVAGALVWPLAALVVILTSAVAYWLVLPLGDPVSSVATSLFLLVPGSWLVLLLLATWALLGARRTEQGR